MISKKKILSYLPQFWDYLKVKFDLSHGSNIEKFGFMFCLPPFLEADLLLGYYYFKYTFCHIFICCLNGKHEGEKEDKKAEEQWGKWKMYLKRGGRKIRRQEEIGRLIWRETPLSLVLWWIWKYICLEGEDQVIFDKKEAMNENHRIWGQKMSHVLKLSTIFHDVHCIGMLRFLRSNHSNQELQYLLISDKTEFKKHIGWCDWNSFLLEMYLSFAEIIMNCLGAAYQLNFVEHHISIALFFF